jgi:hypothetical protein
VTLLEGGRHRQLDLVKAKVGAVVASIEDPPSVL